MVLSVWSVVAVDEVTWTMISGSWRGEERRGERGQQGRGKERSEGRGEGRTEDRMKGRVMGGGESEVRREEGSKKGEEGWGKEEVGRVGKTGII